MLARYCGPGLLGLGITALIAGFMSGMAGNVTAFSTVWTYDIYRPSSPTRPTPTTSAWAAGAPSSASSSASPRLYRAEFSQHHGLRPGLFSFFIAPLFRHRAPRHAVETRHRRGRILGAC
jgi:SSS family solute:Na+ symporter